MYDQTETPTDDLEAVLTALDISIKDYEDSLAAGREFSEYLLAVAIQDLYIAGSLHSGQEVVNIARKYWPLSTTIDA